MRRTLATLASSIVMLGLLSLAPTLVQNAQADGNKTFSEKDVKGSYGFSFDGLLILGDGTPVPVSAVGQVSSDGRGEVTGGTRTLKVGVDAAMQQTASGTYQVNPNGTGTAELLVNTIMPDGSEVPTSLETFSFVINSSRKELHFIGTSIKSPSGQNLGIGVVTRGVARKQ